MIFSENRHPLFRIVLQAESFGAFGGRSALSLAIAVAEFPLARRGKAIMFTAKG
jgi:hypothetical protein